MSDVPYAEILDLARALVRTPSQSRKDDQTAVLDIVAEWAERERLDFHWLRRKDQSPVGGYFHHASKAPGPSLCLAACVDTAPVGDLASWHASPWSASMFGDELFGRGTGDSKVAASIFCHLLRSASRAGAAPGDLYVLLDADEHTGHCPTLGGLKPSPSGDAFRMVAATVKRAPAATTWRRRRFAKRGPVDAEGVAWRPETGGAGCRDHHEPFCRQVGEADDAHFQWSPEATAFRRW
jgi:hypothetical protein